MRPSIAAPLAVLMAGAGAVAYGAGYELRSFRLRRVEVPVLAAGSAPLRVLHLSDAHLLPRQLRKIHWIRSLDTLAPDLVVNTGDSLAHEEAVPAFLDALGPLLDRPGVFVLGSNDYYAPVPKNPARYLLPHNRPRLGKKRLPAEDLRAGMAAAGWVDLSNHRDVVKVDGRTVEVVGVDDPHIELDRYDEVAGPAEPSADLNLGVLHSPEPRVLDRMVADGFSLLLAGHTHGGQLRVPGYGALVTNCGLDTRRARGLSTYPGRLAAGSAWLHVSAGLGTSPYAPVRFACPPEATLLTLVART